MFSMSSLSKLEEGAGIKVLSSLAKIPAQLASLAGVTLHDQAGTSNKKACVEAVIEQWKSVGGKHPPTWKSLLDILKELDLEDLNQAVEDYLHGEIHSYS